MTSNNNEHIINATNLSVEKSRELLQTSLESIEKLAKLQLDASNKVLNDASDTLKQIIAIDNPKDFFEKINQLTTHSVENHVCNCRELYKVMQDVQVKIAKIMQEHIQGSQQHMRDAVEDLSNFNSSSFNGTNFGMNNLANDSIKNWIDGANQVMTNLQKMSSQMQDFFKAATEVGTASVKKNTTK